MAMLSKTGMLFSHRDARDRLASRGVKVSGEKVFFTESEILDWIAKAPAEFQLEAPNPDHRVTIGGDHVEFTPGYGAPMVVDADGSVRCATVNDYILFLKLAQICDHFNLNGGPLVQPDDIPVSAGMATMVCLTHHYSDKGLIVPNGSKPEIELLMEILDLLYGQSFRQGKAMAITILNPISPLQVDENALDMLLLFAKRRQPLIVTAAPMAGTTGPMTLAGSIALANAEVLATITAHQMINPGAPIVYGARASVADMRTGSTTIGNAERTLCSIYSCKMAKAYGLPCRSGGAETDAPMVDVQSGYESMMNLLPTVLEKMNIVVHSAGILCGFGAMSVEKFVVDLEMIGMVKRLMAGIEITSSSLALDVVDEVGSKGNFMMHDHTLKHCRTEARIPLFGSRGTIGKKTDNTDFTSTIEKTKSDLLEQYVFPEATKESSVALNQFLEKKGHPVPKLM